MKERPIIFSSNMVRSILENRKTQTRRIIKPQPEINPEGLLIKPRPNYLHDGCGLRTLSDLACPYGRIGDRLWVKETYVGYDPVIYQADPGNEKQPIWNSPLYMSRKYSRITLEITNVRPERLQDISADDAHWEGVEDCDERGHDDCFYGTHGKTCSFKRLWNSIHQKDGFGWDVNPWVWVIEFKRRKRRIEDGEKRIEAD